MNSRKVATNDTSRISLPLHLSALHDAFLAVDNAALECDGHTLMLSHALSKAKVPHFRLLGKVTARRYDFELFPHLWLQIDDFIVDYRLRMWISLFCGSGRAIEAPHGIFSSIEHPEYTYEPMKPLPGKELEPQLLDLITDGYSSKICIPEVTSSWYSSDK